MIKLFMLVILLNGTVYAGEKGNITFDRRNKQEEKSGNVWQGKINPRPHETLEREEPYLKKMDREALISKSGDRKKKKSDVNFDIFNQRNIRMRWRTNDHDNPRNEEMSQKYHEELDDEWEPQSTAARHRKHKKPFPSLPFLKERKPNIILILTDDQDIELGSLNFMPRTLSLLRDQGADFRHAYVTTPMCCPSRSSLLTGMYVHNHHVFTNNENCSNILWQQTHETRTFATYLSNAGYRTGYFGKYLNKYNGSYIPPGWREWGGLIMNSRYYNYSVNMNGKKIKHGDDYYRDYYPDLIANDSIAFLRQSKKYFSRKPVMLVLSFPAPHGPEDSAPQFSDMFFNITTHHTPTYDYAPNPDKQWILQVTNKMQGIHKQFTDLLMTKRLQTLQSVDVAVERIYNELKALGELDNTYIFYTSDHGYHLGQFGLVKGKSFPFEFDVRVPFLVRGPGVDPGTIVDDIVLNIDLAPTFLDVAGVDAPAQMDGRSILSLLHHRPNKRKKGKWPDTFLIESSGRRETDEEKQKKKLRKKEEEDEEEEEEDKDESTTHLTLSSTTPSTEELGSGSSTYEVPDLELISVTESDEEEEEIEEFESDDISIATETQDDNKILPLAQQPPFVSKLARLAIECRQSDMRSPCRPGQKWHCVLDEGRWRKHKCKFQRKCVCTTSSGLVYSRLENEDRRPIKEMRSEWKRRTQRRPPVLYPFSLLRTKRGVDEIENVSAVIEDVQLELESVNQFNESNHEITRCFVEENGSVNCSHVIHESLDAWRETRDNVEKRIKKLKQQLVLLKTIRKHLRHLRPTEVGEEDTEENDEDDLDLFEGISTTTTMSTRDYNTTFITSTLSTLAPTTRLVTTTRKSPTTGHAEENSLLNRIDGLQVINRDICDCGRDVNMLGQKEVKQLAKQVRQKIKEERMKKKERKMRKKSKMEKECLSEKMNCFTHDNDHWKTPPLWTDGPFCFCMNANNNTYSCLRTINSTHNFLYCEFTTGLRTFYNLRLDPFEQWNRMKSLSQDELNYLSQQLEELKGCKGTKQCTVGATRELSSVSNRHLQDEYNF